MLDIKTTKRTEYKGKTITQDENLIFLYYRDSYLKGEFNCYFPFSYYDATGKGKFHGYGGALCVKDPNDNSLTEDFPQNVDLYICKNGMTNPFKRKKEHLINLQNLVIDIDSHNVNLDTNKYNDCVKILEKKLLKELIIKPNFICYSGRGLHLWYCIEPCHVKLEKVCYGFLEMICKNIHKIIDSDNMGFEIDEKATMNLSGIIRVPYSYNTKSKTWSDGKMIHKSIKNINELVDIMYKNGYKSKKVNRKTNNKKNNKTYISKIDLFNLTDEEYKPCLIHRKQFCDYLFENRDFKEGERDVLFFAAFSCYINLYPIETARQMIIDKNDSIDKPLRYSELCNIFKEVEKKRYKYTVSKFFELVNATTEEKRWFRKDSKQEIERIKKREIKKNRNDMILELYNNGMSIVNISKTMKISRPTIYKVLRN